MSSRFAHGFSEERLLRYFASDGVLRVETECADKEGPAGRRHDQSTRGYLRQDHVFLQVARKVPTINELENSGLAKFTLNNGTFVIRNTRY